MASILNIRKATQNDIEFLASVSLLANEKRLSAETSWNAEHFVKQARTSAKREVQGKVKDSITYVIECDCTPVGRLRVIRPGNEIHIAGIQILPIHQQKGTGSRVLRTMIREAMEKALPLTLEVEKNNPNAKRFYLRLGFKVEEDRGDREFVVLGAEV